MKLLTRNQEELGLEIYKQILEEQNPTEIAQTLGIDEDEFMEMTDSAGSDKLDSLVISSFDNYWGQMTEGD